MRCSKSARTHWRNARLDRITLKNGEDITGGLILHYYLPETRQIVDWPVNATAIRDDYHSLATAAHYLNCPYNPADDFNPTKMTGKLCCIKVQSATEDGKQRLEIVGMLFHLGSLMHAESGRLVGSVRL